MLTITTYFSSAYIAMLLMAVLFYNITPLRARRWVLLIFSYLVFYAISGKLLYYLVFSTLSVHHIGLWLDIVQQEYSRSIAEAAKEDKKALKMKLQKKKQLIMTFALLLHVGILAVLKYSPFFFNNVNWISSLLGTSFQVTVPSYLVPVGISFYTLQAIAYLFDIYRSKIKPDRNLLRLALFMGFFPQFMEGPICRYTDTAASLWEAKRIKYDNFILGIQRILIGFIKKLVVADRLNLLIKNVFLEYDKYDGFVIALSAVLYTLQLYMDFSGAMDLAIGSGEIFGVRLPENFKRPFFSVTISEFWQRWHITLGTWFKDYIFFPLSMSRSLKKLTTKARKKLGNHYGPLISGSIALFAVWLCNGIWHGAGWHYIFFGMYHFVLILCGNMMQPAVLKVTRCLHIDRKCLIYRLMQMIRTGILVCIGELFFRAHGLYAGLQMFKKIFTDFTLTTITDGTLFTYGMDIYDFYLVAVFVIFLLIIGVLQEKGIELRQSINRKPIVVRFAVYYALILFVVIYGAYGTGYVPLDPIYAGF